MPPTNASGAEDDGTEITVFGTDLMKRFVVPVGIPATPWTEAGGGRPKSEHT